MRSHPTPRSPAPPDRHADLRAGLRQGLWIGLAALLLVLPAIHYVKQQRGATEVVKVTVQTPPIAPQVLGAPRFADLRHLDPDKFSAEARQVADWVADSGNNTGMDFVIVDKRHAMVHLFDQTARWLASSPVLLGGARGDDSVPGIGQRPIDQVRPEERTTPAGRFVAERGRNASGEDVVWVDYEAAVSMHRVRLNNPAERRLERLASPTSEDNRISYGCINLPVAFYEHRLRPLFESRRAIVYVLPDVKTVAEVFGAYLVAEAHGLTATPTAGTDADSGSTAADPQAAGRTGT